MEDSADALEVTVEGAKKADAGRGIARLPDTVREELGVLSGDPLVIEGAQPTVAKTWPNKGEVDGEYVRIDADTRANAGVNIGDTVTVQKTSVSEADSLTVRLAEEIGLSQDKREAAVKRALLDRPLRENEQIHIDGVGSFTVAGTEPAGAVWVKSDTDVSVLPPPSAPGEPEDVQNRSVTGGQSSQRADAGGGDGDTDEGSPPSTGVTYEDIGGLDDELDQVREMIELPLSEPELFTRLGIQPPRGVLLYGPPGTGKTLIARAVANEVNAHFDVISGPEVVSKYKGESEEKLRDVFDQAEQQSPAIIFIDEIDAIAGERDEEADMENRLVAQLLTLLDGLQERGQVIVIGATNRVDSVDPALRRGGRFDREIEIGVPDETGRREILQVHTRGMPLGDDVDLDRLASRTHGFVGADIHALTTEAAMHALRRTQDSPAVTWADFQSSLSAVEPSAMREYVAEKPSVTFEDVGGLPRAKETLEQAVEWPLSYGPLFQATETNPPSGILLYGPPGTGKTLLARAIAGESGVNFIQVAGPEIMDRYVGESEEAVREVFDRARQTAPAIVFLDEIDAIASERGDSHEVTQRVVSQLLTELDRVTENPSIVVVAATNRKESIDDALLRPGRLERHVEVPQPDESSRQKILDVHTEGKPIGEDVSAADLAAVTDGYSGAQLEALVREASLRAIRGVASDIEPAEADEHADEVTIDQDDFDIARSTVSPD